MQNFPFFNFNSGAYISGQQIPRVKGQDEAKNYPCPPNTEVVLLDADDETVLYFKKTDANGYCTVDRHRHYPDPEPTQQEINDQRYITVDVFNKFKEEMLDAIRQSRSTYSNNKVNVESSSWKSKSGKDYRNDGTK